MSAMTRISSVALTLLTFTIASQAQDQPPKQWVWLNTQGVFAYGYQIQDGPYRGLWRVDPDSKRAPEDLAPATDPYGFAAILNTYRAHAGLSPLAYDQELSAWAANNNAEQATRGIGHHVVPNCYQNCAWNTPDASSVGQAWMESRGHRANMLNGSVTRFGIAFGPGPYWTMNLRR
jgi:Cysteine-rich secretory protein family